MPDLTLSRPDAGWEVGPSKAKRKFITSEEDLQKLRMAAKLAAETLWETEGLRRHGRARIRPRARRVLLSPPPQGLLQIMLHER